MAYVEDRWFIGEGDAKRPSTRNGNGLRWRVRYETPDGRERSQSFARKPDAERFRVKVGADLLRGTYMDPESGRITLRAFAADWLAARSFDESTREGVEWRLSIILKDLGDKRLDQLAASPSTIQAWVNGLTYAPSTVRQIFAVLSMVFGAALDDGRMVRNPCRMRSVRPPAVPKRKVVPLETAEVDALRDAMAPRYRAMIDAGALCGLRQGEIFGLAKEDIDFLRRTVHVRRQVKIVRNKMVLALPKGRKTRDVPLADVAAAAFSEHIARFPPIGVTLPWHEPKTQRHGRPLKFSLMFTTPVALGAVYRPVFNYREWKGALKKAGILAGRENGMHVLRHSYASVLLHRGVDIKRVAECLGHGDPGFTLRVYTHLMEGGDEQVRRALDSAMTGPLPAQEAK